MSRLVSGRSVSPCPLKKSIAATLSTLTRARGCATAGTAASNNTSGRMRRSALRTERLQVMHGFGARRHPWQRRHERADDFGVVLGAGTAPQLAQRVLGRSPRAIGAGARDRVVRVRDVHDSGKERNVAAAQTVRIPAAVRPLVMQLDDGDVAGEE